MVFSSAVFILAFLPIVFIGNRLLDKRYSNVFMLIASIIFYAWGEPVTVIIMLAVIALNWGVGCVLGMTSGRIRRAVLAVGVVCNLSVLFYYKYRGFFCDTINNLLHREVFTVAQIALPIGISFYTFQAISYIVDVYRDDTKPSYNIINVALYISFFPQLIAGPIVKYRDINEQIVSRSASWTDVAEGFKRFTYGLGKKVLIANVLGECVDIVNGYNIADIDSRMAWIGAFAYTFQLYYDFSGYSDMAIGLGRMFGFKIPENFNYPYMATSVADHWRRWHISLATWFKEYVYIPLGGSRKGKARTYLNQYILFALTGLWHGAASSYIFWGLYNGTFLVIERLGFRRILDKFKFFGLIYSFAVVLFGHVIFRTENIMVGAKYISRMIRPWRYHSVAEIPLWEYADIKTFTMLALGILGAGVIQRFIPQKVRSLWHESVPEAIYCVALLVISLAAIASDTYNPFIYFQF